MRAAGFLAGLTDADLKEGTVAVGGGCSGATIAELLSQFSFCENITGPLYDQLVHGMQFDDDDDVKAKGGARGATHDGLHLRTLHRRIPARPEQPKGRRDTDIRQEHAIRESRYPVHIIELRTWLQRCRGVIRAQTLSAEEKVFAACPLDLKKNIDKSKAFGAST